MTREELRDYVDEQRSLGNIPYHVYSTLIDGIDTLEQEPFINKPCVSSEVCEHDKQKFLDKIRAEIKHFMFDVNPSSSESDYACNYILDILDKYKADKEQK